VSCRGEPAAHFVLQMNDEIRKLVRFARINLIEVWPPLPIFDVVLLRNVLIYFAPQTKRHILANVRRQLAPDGTRFLGGAETTMGIDNDWERVRSGKVMTYCLS
jgi:chemotaxis protein methyltransferase CheR